MSPFFLRLRILLDLLTALSSCHYRQSYYRHAEERSPRFAVVARAIGHGLQFGRGLRFALIHQVGGDSKCDGTKCGSIESALRYWAIDSSNRPIFSSSSA
jgi:hypothetical protein